jgi:hypothetical protein
MMQLAQTLALLGMDETHINELALKTNFKKRIRKLSGFDYILMLLTNASKDMMSYNTLASSFHQNPLKSLQRQALHKTMKNETFLHFIEEVFNCMLMKKIGHKQSKFSTLFSRIVIQDSTIVKLPQRLFQLYSGIKNQFKQVTNSRIQFTIDILKNTFLGMSVDAYSINDAKAAPKLQLQKGDLILRDRGYFLISEMVRIIEAAAFFIYRHHAAYQYYDIKTGEALDLYKIFKKRKFIDMQVKLGRKNGTIVRLLAMPIDEKIAAHRRVMAKEDRRNNPSKSALALLSWSIYITNINDENVTYSEIFEFYKLRWRIEIIFKTLKSNLKLDSIHNVSDIQFKFIVMAKMMMIVLTIQFIYEPLVGVIQKLYNKVLSLLKLVRFIMDNTNILKELIEYLKKGKKKKCNEIDTLAKYCCYDKRKRMNYEEHFESVLS